MVNFSCFKRNCYLHITVFKESESEPTKKLGSGTKAKKLCTGSAKVKDIFIPAKQTDILLPLEMWWLIGEMWWLIRSDPDY